MTDNYELRHNLLAWVVLGGSGMGNLLVMTSICFSTSTIPLQQEQEDKVGGTFLVTH